MAIFSDLEGELLHTHPHIRIPRDKANILVKRATTVSIITALIIVIAKIVGWYITGSTSILASLTDSAMDIIASFINFTAAIYAMQPPDDEHRFGHGKAEDLAVLIQSVFCCLSILFVLVASIKRIVYPEYIRESETGISIMLLSVILSTVLVAYQSYVVSRTRSTIVHADRMHYLIDLSTNASVIFSLYIAERFHNRYVDPIVACLVVLYISYSASRLFVKSLNNLMDREFADRDKEKLHAILASHPKIKGYHDLKTRYAANKPFIQVHIELDSKMTLKESHQIAEELESYIFAVFPEADVIIHQDPDDVEETQHFKH